MQLRAPPMKATKMTMMKMRTSRKGNILPDGQALFGSADKWEHGSNHTSGHVLDISLLTGVSLPYGRAVSEAIGCCLGGSA